MTTQISQCSRCKHLKLKRRKGALPEWVCPAYPDGIPGDVESNLTLHLRPLRGQVGETVWEPTAEAKKSGYKPDHWRWPDDDRDGGGLKE